MTLKFDGWKPGLKRLWSWLIRLSYVVAVVGLVGFVWLAWAKWGAPTALTNLCPQKDDCEYLGQVGDLFGGVNALFAGLAFAGLVLTLEASRKQNAEQRQWEKDEELVNQICSSYQWAHDALEEISQVTTDHGSVRRGWLVAARHLLRAEKLVKDIETDVFKTIQQEHEEMWRSRLHRLTSDVHSLSIQASTFLQPVIELRSALVVAVFIVGGKDWKDPINEVDAHELFESDSWEGTALSRVIKQHVVRVRPEFVEEHLRMYPDGRIAQQRHRYATSVEQMYREGYAPSPPRDSDQENPSPPQT